MNTSTANKSVRRVCKPELMPGDILVQYQGEPWCTLAKIITGAPYPHAAIVSRVEGDRICIIEASADGIKEKEPAAEWFLDFIARRPLTDDATVRAALAWIRKHVGQGYGFGHLAEIAIGYPLGLRTRPGMDNDVSQDSRKKVCSETIAMGFLRGGQKTGSGFDIALDVCDRDTLPKDLRFTDQARTLLPFYTA